MEMDVEWGGVSYSIEVPEGAGPGREITVQLPSLDEPLGGGSGVYGVADGKAPSCNMPHNPTCSVSQFAPPMEPSTHSRKFAERSCFNDGFTTSKDVLRDKPGHLSLREAAADHGHAANADLINLLRSLGQQPRSSEARNEPGAAAVLPVEPSEPLDRPGGRGSRGREWRRKSKLVREMLAVAGVPRHCLQQQHQPSPPSQPSQMSESPAVVTELVERIQQLEQDLDGARAASRYFGEAWLAEQERNEAVKSEIAAAEAEVVTELAATMRLPSLGPPSSLSPRPPSRPPTQKIVPTCSPRGDGDSNADSAGSTPRADGGAGSCAQPPPGQIFHTPLGVVTTRLEGQAEGSAVRRARPHSQKVYRGAAASRGSVEPRQVSQFQSRRGVRELSRATDASVDDPDAARLPAPSPRQDGPEQVQYL